MYPEVLYNIDLSNPLIYQKLNSKTNHNNTSPKKVALVLGQSSGTHCVYNKL
jgi:hypothetical protein